MSLPSPLVLINGSPQVNGYNAIAGDTVTVSLASNYGVYTWDILCIGTDELNTAASVNATLVINPASMIATFTMPNNDGYGTALIFQSTINNGMDVNGLVQSIYTTTFGVYVLTTAGNRVGAQNETIEGNAIYGWLTKFNPIARIMLADEITFAGDLSGNHSSQNVIGLYGASIPQAGSLTVGNTLQVSGVSSLTYASINLAGGSNVVYGLLPTANQVQQSMVGDVTGTTGDNVVSTITGSGGIVQIGATIEGNASPVSYSIANIVMPSDANLTLSSSQYNSPILRITSTPTLTATRSIILPAISGASYSVYNNTTGTQSLTFIASTGSGVTVPHGLKTLIYFDGTNYVTGSIIVGGDLTATSNTSQTVAKIQGNTITSGALVEGDLLIATSTSNWAATAVTGDVSFSATTPGKTTVIALQGNAVEAQSLGAAQDGYSLTWKNASSQWQAQPAPSGSFSASGDLSGTSSSQTVIGIQGNPVESGTLGSTQDGYVLTWVNASSQWQAQPTGIQFFGANGTWVCPGNVYFVNLIGAGGGGGGNGGSASSGGLGAGGAGGTGGAASTQSVAHTYLPVTPGTSYTVTIGSGGTAGSTSGGSGGNGGTTSFAGGVLGTISFTGGTGGGSSTGTGGAAGSGSGAGSAGNNGTASTYFSGGTGGAGGTHTSGTGSAGGGGGGGDAGPLGIGANGGAGGVGGTGSTNGSAGSNGVANSGDGGGGGGGGGGKSGGTNLGSAGGTGGSGYLNIQYL
jgi:hypothetical protein